MAIRTYGMAVRKGRHFSAQLRQLPCTELTLNHEKDN
jgi:hypothetical protein